MAELQGKTAVVVGTGKSGQGAARLLSRLGASVKVSDTAKSADIPADFMTWAGNNNVVLETGGHTQAFFENSDLVVISPGVRWNADILEWARLQGIKVIGEMELAARVCAKPMIAVTGSNGKTTVATLIHEVICRSGKTAALCGNIGAPLSDYVMDPVFDYYVLEVSSFQLEATERFKPRVAVFTNFSQNHLDRHRDLAEYLGLKLRLFSNQDKSDFAVLNAAEKSLKDAAGRIRGQIRWFNTEEQKERFGISNPNYLAVLAVAQVLKINEEVCRDVFNGFRGVEHRCEHVRTLDGVEFINDSKATTAEAGRWALERIQQPVIMICGGRDKNVDFSVVKDIVGQKVKTMILIGEARTKIKSAFAEVTRIHEAGSLIEAVQLARESAAPGECVVLSPMCASFDMFKNYEERGIKFKQIVNELS